MAKSEQRIRRTLGTRKDTIAHQIEQSVTSDDNLLPDADEVERYHAIDPTILDWLKEKAGQEQDFRHKIYSERLSLVVSNEQRIHLLNIVGLCFGFVFLIMGLCLSVYLILKGCSIAGSVFTGFTLLMGAGLLIARKMPLLRVPKEKPDSSEMN